MKLKIVQLVIKDDEIQDSRYLINPDKNKLEELKYMIEHRFDYQFEDTLSDEEIEKAENFCNAIWGHVERFIEQNFIIFDIDEIYEIDY